MNTTILKECEKINYNPMVLSYSLFDIVDYETNIKGYWKRNNKIFIDNINKINISVLHRDYLNLLINNLLHNKNQICVAYKNVYNELVIDNGLTRKALKNQIHILEDKKPSQKYIKELLKNNDGLTIYNLNEGKYLIEIYK